MDDREFIDDPVAREAAEWVLRRDRGLSREENRALKEWESADPRHRAELHRISHAWKALDGIGAVPTLHALADDVMARARARGRRRRRSNRVAAGFAAAAAIALGFFGWQRTSALAPTALLHASENVKVITSTLRTMNLPDGSIAELNGNSRIEVEFTPAARRVRLIDGEAHFIVAKNPERPFFVTAGEVTVRAVGTAFNVRLASSAIEVLVTEGKVQLDRAPTPAELTSPVLPASNQPVAAEPATSSAALVAGQRAVIDRTETPATPAMAIDVIDRREIDEVLGWQTTRLVFSNTPLADVVAGFNRYNRHQLTLGDSRLRARTLTGTFRADNVEGFVRLLRASVDVKAELRTPNETVLLPLR